MKLRQNFRITAKGRIVLHGATLWALSRHLRDVLALCDPQVDRAALQQFLPPDSLHAALHSLQQLELIEGPAVPAPDHTQWAFESTPSRRLTPLRANQRPESRASAG
jgi:hypothetical protein